MPTPDIKLKQVKVGNLIVKLIITVAEDNQGTIVPDFIIEVFVFGIQLWKGRVTL